MAVEDKYRELISEIEDLEGSFIRKLGKLKDILGTEDLEREESKIRGLLMTSEETYLKTKALVFYISELAEERGGDLPKVELASSIEMYSDEAFLFRLPPMRSVRKRNEKTNLGRAMWHEMMTLISAAREECPLPTNLTDPVIKFVHHVSSEDAEKRFIPDPDNLDTSKVIDALEAGALIANDSILDITIIQEGKISDKSETEVYIYTKNHEKDYENCPIFIMNFAKIGNRANSYNFTPYRM